MLRNAKILNLWHGVGTKNIERGPGVPTAITSIAAKWIKYNRDLRERQLFLVTSEIMESHFQKRINLSDKQIIRGDYPIHEFLDKYFEKHSAEKLKTIIGDYDDEKLIVYAPTWRTDSGGNFLREALIDIEKLRLRLEELNMILIIKLHPRMIKAPYVLYLKNQFSDDSSIRFWNDNFDFYEFVNFFHLAIVDYSSISFDLVRRGIKQMIRYIFDEEQYNSQQTSTGAALSTRDPDLPGSLNEPGTIIKTFEDLINKIDQDHSLNSMAISELNQNFWSFKDVNSMDQIIEKTKKYEVSKLNLQTLYSFDVFDTIIKRSGVFPDSIFQGVQQYINKSELTFPSSFISDYSNVRKTAERRAREQLKNSNPEGQKIEISFEDIFSSMRSFYELNDEQTNFLKERELELEYISVQPKSEQLKYLFELHEAGENVVLISDMYLEETFINQMLSKVNPKLLDIQLFLSSTHGYQKSTGKLFTHVFEKLNYDYSNWVHSGDNLHSDISIPKKLGISTLHISGPTLSNDQRAFISSISSFDAHQILPLMEEIEPNNPNSNIDWVQNNYLAFILVPYVSWVIQNSISEGYKTLYFVARDGYLLKIIADSIIQQKNLPIKTDYIYGSRKAWRLASETDVLSDYIFGSTGIFTGALSIQDVIEIIGINYNEFINILPEFKSFERNQKLSIRQRNIVISTISKNEAIHNRLLKNAMSLGKNAAGYLSQNIDFSEKFAFVEFWGRGTTQDSLQRLLQKATGSEVECVMYYARSIHQSEPNLVRKNFVNFDFKIAPIEAVLSNVPESTTTGYEFVNGKYKPQFSKNAEFDLHFFNSSVESLLKFAKGWASTFFIEEFTLGQAMFKYANDLVLDSSNTAYFSDSIGKLRYSGNMNTNGLQEFAPPISIKMILKILTGEKLNSLTHSREITIYRSNIFFRFIYWLVKFHMSKKIKRKIRNVFTRYYMFFKNLNSSR